MSQNIIKLLKFSHYLADEARKISLRYYKKNINVVSKIEKGFDPVTVADIKIQKKLNKLLSKFYPSHSVIGEEDSIIKDSEYEWCIDPIDGTKSYIQGIPLWGTLISLAKKGEVILGLADIPALDERYFGYSKVSYKIIKGKKSKLKIRNISNLKNSILNSTSPYVFASKSDQLLFEKLANKVKSTRLGGDCYSYCLLSDGHIDIVVESGLKPWDIRALEPIIKYAGGYISTWEGKSVINGGRIIACNNEKLYNAAQKVLIKKNPVKK